MANTPCRRNVQQITCQWSLISFTRRHKDQRLICDLFYAFIVLYFRVKYYFYCYKKPYGDQKWETEHTTHTPQLHSFKQKKFLKRMYVWSYKNYFTLITKLG